MPLRNTGPISLLAALACAEDRRILTEILGHTKWRFSLSGSAAEACRLMRQREYSVVIADRLLPDGTWHSILDEIGRTPNPAALIVAVATDEDDVRLWAEVMNLGGEDLLLKPFEQNAVLWSVSSAWRQLRLRSRHRLAWAW